MADSDKSWHSASIVDVEAELETGREGLTAAEVSERKKRFGPNEIEREPPTSALALLLHQFKASRRDRRPCTQPARLAASQGRT